MTSRPSITIYDASPKRIERTEWFDVSKVTKRNHFEPKFSSEKLNARQRKQQEIMGSDYVGSVVVEGSVRDLNTAPIATPQSVRRCQSPFFPTTMNWVDASNVPRPRSAASSKDHKLQTSEFIPTTMPWTTRTEKPPSDDSNVGNFQKQKMEHLFPATMPWITEVPHPRACTSDYRRRRGFALEQVPLPVCVPGAAMAAEMVNYKVSGLKRDASEKTVRDLLIGLHVVEVRIDLDILANTCRGNANITLRLLPEDETFISKELLPKLRQQGIELIKHLY